MRTITQIILLFALGITTVQAQKLVDITVVVKGFKSTAGTVKVQMVDKNNKEIFGKIATLTSTTFTITIQVSTIGQYAVNVIHDKNNNSKLDTNIFGIPKEGWGCSNDARGVMSAPKLKDKLFMADKNKTITINLVHY